MALPINLDCLRIAANFLPDSALEAVINVLTAAQAALNAQVALLKSQILTLDFALAPLRVQKAALQATLNAVTSQFKIIDMGLVSQCTSLGDMNAYVLDSVSNVTTAINNTLNIIDRKLAIIQSFENKIDLIQSKINFLFSVKQVFQTALANRTAAKLAVTMPAISQVKKQVGL